MSQIKDRTSWATRNAARSSNVTTYVADYGRSSGRCGSSKGAHTNTLLLQSPVGKSKPSCYALPPEDHVYGMLVERKGEGSGQVLSSWQTKQKTKNAVPSLDYVAMNKLCAQEGIVDPRGQYEHRKEHPIRVKVIDHSTGRRTSRRLPSDTNANFTYGKPTRASSPVSKLMTDHYQREYDELMQSREEERMHALAAKMKHPARRDILVPLQKPKPKKQTIFERDPETLFKMPRFRGADARVDCWRGDQPTA